MKKKQDAYKLRLQHTETRVAFCNSRNYNR